MGSSEIEHRASDTGGGFFVEREGKRVASLTYKEREGVVVADHTWVDPSLRGEGMAGKLVDALVDWARREGRRVEPVCPYIRKTFDDDPQRYAEVRSG